MAITLKGTGDFEQLEKEYAKLHQEQIKLKAGLQGVSRESRKAGSQQSNMLRTGIRQVGQMAVGYLSVQGAVRLVSAEVRTLIAVQDRAAEASMTVADAQIAFLRNLGATSVEERDKAIANIQAISAEAGVAERDLYLRASAAVSARGPLDISVAMEAVKESARLAPEATEAGTAIAGAGLDIAKITGVEDVQKNIGLLMAIGQTARVVDVGMLAEHVAPALTGGVAYGGTAREAGAVWSAVTGGMADPTGRKSSTAVISLATQLAKFLPEETRYGYDKRGRRKIEAEGTGLTSLIERIRFLQENQIARERFLGQASFQVKAKASIEQMLAGTGAVGQALDQYLERIPRAEDAGGIYQQRLTVMRETELQRTAALGRALGATIESVEAGNVHAAREAMVRKQFVKVLEDAGTGWLESRARLGRAWIKGGAPEDYVAELEDRRREMPEGIKFKRGFPLIGTTEPREVLRRVRAIDDFLEVLEGLKGGMERSEQELPRQTDLLKQIRDGLQTNRQPRVNPAAYVGQHSE